MLRLPSLDDLQAAFSATRRATQATPLLESRALAEATGAARAFVKAESLQRAGSFKIRGAYWRLTTLSEEARARGVIAYSSGNFAQGLAAAGEALGVPVSLVMPDDAPAAKIEATRAFGARVMLSHAGDRPREEAAAALASETAQAEGLTLLHPFDDPVIVAGQAAAGLEAIEQAAALPDPAAFDAVLVCVGGGGLAGGVSLAMHALAPEARLWAVEPEGWNAMGASLAAGERVRVAGGAPTICDALQATLPGEAPFAAARLARARGLDVTDDEVRAAMRFAFERLKLVLEPSGAVALAAALAGKAPLAGRTILIYATGGNVTLPDFLAGIGET